MVKKEVKEKVEKKIKIPKERKLEKEILWIIGFFGFLVILFLVASSFFKSLNQIEHDGITFNKERLGEIPVYHYSYYFENRGNLIKYNMYLRNDPRYLNFSVEGDEIIFDRGKAVYVSLDPDGLQECEQGVLAIADLSSFLTDNQFTVESANPDFWDAGRNRQDWITCENKADRIVIEIREGNETRIDVENNCIQISIANCQILEAIERFKVQSIIDARDYKFD